MGPGQRGIRLASQPPAPLSYFFPSSSKPVVCHSKGLLLICSLISSLHVRAKPTLGSVTPRGFNTHTLHWIQTQAGRWGCWISHHSSGLADRAESSLETTSFCISRDKGLILPFFFLALGCCGDYLTISKQAEPFCEADRHSPPLEISSCRLQKMHSLPHAP